MSSSTTDMIAASVNRIFSERVDRQLLADAEAGNWPGELWDLLEESGFCETLLMIESGEGDGPWHHAYPVFHAIGFHRLPLPLAEAIVGNALLGVIGLEPLEGAMTLIEQDRALDLRIDGQQLLVNGAAASVPWARRARTILVTGRAQGKPVLGLLPTGTAGVTIAPAQNIAGEPRDSVSFQDAPCSRWADAQSLPAAPITLFGALARAAQMVGAAESVLQQSIDYANERVQFGRPIAKYQAIQQSLALLAGELACAQTATLAACRSTALVPSEFAVATAKIRAGQAAAVAANIAHEVHGAFGFTHEHTLHYATRRLWSWRAEYGSESTWAARLGRQAIERGGDAFWDTLTAPLSPPQPAASF